MKYSLSSRCLVCHANVSCKRSRVGREEKAVIEFASAESIVRCKFGKPLSIAVVMPSQYGSLRRLLERPMSRLTGKTSNAPNPDGSPHPQA